jgi:hypothetical protein
VYRPDLGGLARDLPENALRTGRRRRKTHRHAGSRRPQPLVDMTMIDARPRWPTVPCRDIGRAIVRHDVARVE